VVFEALARRGIQIAEHLRQGDDRRPGVDADGHVRRAGGGRPVYDLLAPRLTAERVRPLEERDPRTPRREVDRGGEAPRTAADDGDVEGRATGGRGLRIGSGSRCIHALKSRQRLKTSQFCRRNI
jgi:hypothetical protein